MSAPAGPEPVRTGAAYEAVRDTERARLAEVKRDRRVTVGGFTVVFENAASIRGALEESLRADHVTEPAEVEAGAEAFVALGPGEDELCACVYVEAADQAELGSRLRELSGCGGSIHLDIDGARVVAREDGDPDEGAMPAVRVVRFRLDAGQRAALGAASSVDLVVEHPSVGGRVPLTDAQRKALIADL